MAPSTRRKAATEAENLMQVLNSSPIKVKAAAKKKEEAERRAAEAAKKRAEKEKTAKKKLLASSATAKVILDTNDADYSSFDKETALLLTKSDADLQFNVAKVLFYTDLLAGFNHKKWPTAASDAKARLKRYTSHVEALRKARAALIKSAKSSKGKQKANADFDPSAYISSGEYEFHKGPPPSPAVPLAPVLPPSRCRRLPTS
jgi:hypothetical protein